MGTSTNKRFLPIDEWDKSAVTEKAGWPSIHSSVEGRSAYAGLVFSPIENIAAWILFFPREDPDSEAVVLSRFFMPRCAAESTPWATLGVIRHGLIELVEGNVIDFGQIKEAILDDAEQFNIKEIAFDRWGSQQIVRDLEAEGFTVISMSLGFCDMNAPTKELLSLVRSGRFVHDANPVMRLMAMNLEVIRDPAGNLKPNFRERYGGAIEGIVALIMAIGCHLGRGQNETTRPEEPGVTEILESLQVLRIQKGDVLVFMIDEIVTPATHAVLGHQLKRIFGEIGEMPPPSMVLEQGMKLGVLRTEEDSPVVQENLE